MTWFTYVIPKTMKLSKLTPELRDNSDKSQLKINYYNLLALRLK